MTKKEACRHVRSLGKIYNKVYVHVRTYFDGHKWIYTTYMYMYFAYTTHVQPANALTQLVFTGLDILRERHRAAAAVLEAVNSSIKYSVRHISIRNFAIVCSSLVTWGGGEQT